MEAHTVNLLGAIVLFTLFGIILHMWRLWTRRTTLQIEWLEQKIEEGDDLDPEIEVTMNGKPIRASLAKQRR